MPATQKKLYSKSGRLGFRIFTVDQSRQGFMLLEVVISLLLLSATVVLFILAFRQVYQTQAASWISLQASSYALDGIEGASYVLQNAEEWEDWVVDSNFFLPVRLSLSDQVYLLPGEEVVQDTFTRRIELRPVYRDTQTGKPSSDPDQGVRDEAMIEIVSRIVWIEGTTQRDVEYQTYVLHPEYLSE